MTPEPQSRPSLRVIAWGTGAVGVEAMRMLLASKHVEIVGARCFTDAKDGVDVGELAGVTPTGVAATRDSSALLALEADCVLFAPRDDFDDPSLAAGPSWVDDVVGILESGKNVVSPLQPAMHWRHLAHGERVRDRLDKAAHAGGSSLFFTGLDPGFMSDAMVILMSSAVTRLDQIKTTEVTDYADYNAISTLESFGFGQVPEELAHQELTSFVSGWGSALWLVADALGAPLDDVVPAADYYCALDDFVSPGGFHVRAGTVGAVRWSVTGMISGEPRIVCSHIARIGTHMAPEWPRVGDAGGYRIQIEGWPTIAADFPLGLPGGTGSCLGDGLLMTAARCVNAIPAVVEAPPGYHLLNSMRTPDARLAFA